MNKLFLGITALILMNGNLIAQNPEWVQFTNGDNVQVLADDGHNLWIGGYAGLVKLDRASEDLTFYNNANSGLPNNSVSAIAPDANGNVWIGVSREAMLMAHASAAAYATVEEIVEFDLLLDPQTAPGTIPGLYITAIARAQKGAWPLGVPHLYERDHAHLALYAQMARSQEGFDAYTDQWVMHRIAAQ